MVSRAPYLIPTRWVGVTAGRECFCWPICRLRDERSLLHMSAGWKLCFRWLFFFQPGGGLPPNSVCAPAGITKWRRSRCVGHPDPHPRRWRDFYNDNSRSAAPRKIASRPPSATQPLVQLALPSQRAALLLAATIRFKRLSGELSLCCRSALISQISDSAAGACCAPIPQGSHPGQFLLYQIAKDPTRLLPSRAHAERL